MTKKAISWQAKAEEILKKKTNMDRKIIPEARVFNHADTFGKFTNLFYNWRKFIFDKKTGKR